MVSLLKRLVFCVVLNDIIGAARLALSSVTREAHAAQDSVSKYLKFAHHASYIIYQFKSIIIDILAMQVGKPSVALGGSNSAIAISKTRRPSKQKQIVGQEYGIIPDGTHERKGEFPNSIMFI
jgi:hypothetical protein